MINIEGKTYAFNLKKIFEIINYSDKNNTREKEITDAYEIDETNGELGCTSKIVREVTTPGNSQIDNIKYDMIKSFVVQLLSIEQSNNSDYIWGFGNELAFNTLLAEGLIYEIKF